MEVTHYVKAETVGDLIAVLAYLPKDARVDLEGCDCYGLMSALIYEQDRNRVALERENHGWYGESITVSDFLWLQGAN